ncbi:unnamed protein product [Polarella glacialis]|uniref:Uncharacterized protein n=1 Tax=Polarella glacialis TaxID=89957 RepID=A0A813FH03_POLGL|nr:unnamed protein product [Polarella glacialis]
MAPGRYGSSAWDLLSNCSILQVAASARAMHKAAVEACTSQVEACSNQSTQKLGRCSFPKGSLMLSKAIGCHASGWPKLLVPRFLPCQLKRPSWLRLRGLCSGEAAQEDLEHFRSVQHRASAARGPCGEILVRAMLPNGRWCPAHTLGFRGNVGVKF